MDIRRLTEAEMAEYVRIVANAYPGFGLNTAEVRQRALTRWLALDAHPAVSHYALFRDAALLGGMKLHNFQMRLFETTTLVGGVGLVAVDLAHKRQQVAKDLITFFLRHFRDRGACLVALYPFRPDFYGEMGFGYGTKLSQYRVRPTALPRGPKPSHISLLGPADREAAERCYHRYFERTHGMMERDDVTWKGMFDSQTQLLIGYRDGEEIRGYAQFELKADTPTNVLKQNMIVHELIYERPEALAEIVTFMHTQFDQVDRIVFNTQDDDFVFLLSDPRNASGNMLAPVYHESNAQGMGLMYRLIDTGRYFSLLAQHNFGGVNCLLRIKLRDSFFPENDGITTIRFIEGQPRLVEPDEPGLAVEIGINVADFSSVAMGVVPFSRIFDFGRATIGDERDLVTVDTLFHADQKPICLTSF
jgi:predicted acetyltransferase